eukprot:7151259-Pyramimonas_sp.AAC.1
MTNDLDLEIDGYSVRRLKATSTHDEVLPRLPCVSASSDAMVRFALSGNAQAGACSGLGSRTARPPTCTPPPPTAQSAATSTSEADATRSRSVPPARDRLEREKPVVLDVRGPRSQTPPSRPPSSAPARTSSASAPMPPSHPSRSPPEARTTLLTARGGGRSRGPQGKTRGRGRHPR